MKTIAAVKIGSLRDKNPETRGRVQVLDLPEQALGPEDVRIRVAYCAICGSDPHLIEGIFGWEPPFGLGHEVSGIVVELGEKAVKKGLKIGDRVAGNFLKFCGVCDYCQNGQQQFCTFADEYNRPGMAESVVWHESQVFRLPDTVSLKQGCLLEPVSIAVRMMDKLKLKIGQRALVCGGGPIGLLALQALKHHGASKITLVEPIAPRRALAEKFGAAYTLDPQTQDVYREAMRMTAGKGYDVVIDASGSVRAAETLPPLTARGGTLLYGAMYPNHYTLPLNLYQYCYLNELTITGFYVAPYAFPRALELLPALALEEFTTTVFNLDDAEQAFAAQISGEHVKILIRCNRIDGE